MNLDSKVEARRTWLSEWMYVLTKISWSGFISQTAERKNLDSKVEAQRTWLSKWMKFSHQNFKVRFYLAESPIAWTLNQMCKHKEPDFLNGSIKSPKLPGQLWIKCASTRNLTIWMDVGSLTKASWLGFTSQKAQWHELWIWRLFLRHWGAQFKD